MQKVDNAVFLSQLCDIVGKLEQGRHLIEFTELSNFIEFYNH